MAQMNISNSLWNDTQEAVIAFAKQLYDNDINWNDSTKTYNETYVDEHGDTQPAIPQAFKNNANKFQSKLNELFLDHYADFQMFLHDKGVAGVIDTWRDVEEFLENISDQEAYTLMGLIAALEEASGQLNIRMSTSIPGMLEAVTSSTVPIITNSHIDQETGDIKIIYNYE